MNDQPEELPKSTYWPFFFSFATTLIAWGLVTSGILIGVGGLILFVAIAGWLKEMS